MSLWPQCYCDCTKNFISYLSLLRLRKFFPRVVEVSQFFYSAWKFQKHPFFNTPFFSVNFYCIHFNQDPPEGLPSGEQIRWSQFSLFISVQFWWSKSATKCIFPHFCQLIANNECYVIHGGVFPTECRHFTSSEIGEILCYEKLKHRLQRVTKRLYSRLMRLKKLSNRIKRVTKLLQAQVRGQFSRTQNASACRINTLFFKEV